MGFFSAHFAEARSSMNVNFPLSNLWISIFSHHELVWWRWGEREAPGIRFLPKRAGGQDSFAQESPKGISPPWGGGSQWRSVRMMAELRS